MLEHRLRAYVTRVAQVSCLREKWKTGSQICCISLFLYKCWRACIVSVIILNSIEQLSITLCWALCGLSPAHQKMMGSHSTELNMY